MQFALFISAFFLILAPSFEVTFYIGIVTSTAKPSSTSDPVQVPDEALTNRSTSARPKPVG